MKIYYNAMVPFLNSYVHTYTYTHIDVNECFDGMDICDTNADCVNTNGSFECICRPGYVASGLICRGNKILKCMSLCCPVCISSEFYRLGVFKCICIFGCISCSHVPLEVVICYLICSN